MMKALFEGYESLVELHEDSLYESKHSLENLSGLVQHVAETLQNHGFFCLWLQGNLGAGKTTFTRSLLSKLGLHDSITVGSPTFTYLNEYEINNKIYAHMDFYRLPKNSLVNQMFDLEKFDGFFLEWPQQIAIPPLLEPTHFLHITKEEGSQLHSYRFTHLKQSAT